MSSTLIQIERWREETGEKNAHLFLASAEISEEKNTHRGERGERSGKLHRIEAPTHAKLAREAADASARKRKAADGGGEGDAAATVPEEAVMGEAAAAAAAPEPVVEGGGGGGGEGLNRNPSGGGGGGGGGCSDSVSVELSMGGDYYHSCCGDPDPDLRAPEGPKLPYVGDKEPLSTLAAEFQSGSPILQEKIKLLGEQYDALRRTRGDGNCFYRSFMFSYLEHILETQDKAEVERILKKIEQCKKTLADLGYIEFTFEDFFSIFIDQLESVLQGHESSIGAEELLERTRDQMVSDYGLFVTSGEIQRRAEFFEPFISGLTNSTVVQFCKASVEPMGEESDHVHIIALSDALGVPIRVMYLDRSSCDAGNISVNHHDFSPEANSSDGAAAAAEKPYITLLYRPGHYDILYPK
uniref:ubiquitinyl hydrolase 1 n=1 Tax=Oryza glumipatula TaxID=40148 RepID=A0A0E0AY82_9ORYZ